MRDGLLLAVFCSNSVIGFWRCSGAFRKEAHQSEAVANSNFAYPYCEETAIRVVC